MLGQSTGLNAISLLSGGGNIAANFTLSPAILTELSTVNAKFENITKIGFSREEKDRVIDYILSHENVELFLGEDYISRDKSEEGCIYRIGNVKKFIEGLFTEYDINLDQDTPSSCSIEIINDNVRLAIGDDLLIDLPAISLYDINSYFKKYIQESKGNICCWKYKKDIASYQLKENILEIYDCDATAIQNYLMNVKVSTAKIVWK